MVQRLEARDLSLDVRSAPDSALGLVDRLAAPENQEQALLELQVGGSVRSAVARALRELDPRERYIAEQRLMADPQEELSLAEIARTLGISRERARQLEARTERKQRTSIPALGNAIVSEWLAPPDAA